MDASTLKIRTEPWYEKVGFVATNPTVPVSSNLEVYSESYTTNRPIRLNPLQHLLLLQCILPCVLQCRCTVCATVSVYMICYSVGLDRLATVLDSIG